MRVIQTGCLTLEPQTAVHAEEMFAVLSDPAIYEYENQPPPSLEWLRTRFTKLESRLSANGREQWLNWVIRLPTSELIGYVQATVHPNHRAAIAYDLSSAYWGRGLAPSRSSDDLRACRTLPSTHPLHGAQTRESSLDALARAPGFLASIA